MLFVRSGTLEATEVAWGDIALDVDIEREGVSSASLLHCGGVVRKYITDFLAQASRWWL